MAVKKVQRSTRAPLQRSVQTALKNKRQQKHEVAVNTKKKKKAVIIAQEIKFARLLASNDKRVRDKILKNLKKWLTVRSKSSFAFTETDFMRLWKGLFYCMWMSDKPLIQEELAESLSKVVHCFDTKDVVLLYTECVLKTLGTEWYGIDQYRLDKFAMLVRRIIRQTFQKCKEKLWDIEWIKGISKIIEKFLLDPKIGIGFGMHITEVYLEELSKISCGDIPEDVVTELVKPFVAYLIPMDDERQIRHVIKHVFRYLIFQSDVGLEYKEKFEAWKQAGFPTGSIDAMEKIEISDEEEDEEEEEKDEEEEEKDNEDQVKCTKERPLDPRAGRVDVELSQIPFNAKKIAQLLTQHKFHPSSTAKSRRQILRLIKEFTELSQGKMPLGIKEIQLPSKRKTDTKSAALRLLEFEQKLYSDTIHKKRKRKKNGELGTEDEDFFNGTVEDTSAENGTIEKEEIESTRKKKKTQHKKSAANDSTQPDFQESNAIVPGSKKKKSKTEKKVDVNHEIDVQSSNCKLKKGTSLLTNNNSRCKKLKVKRNETNAASTLNIVTPVKKKKLTKLKVCGQWDVSNSEDSATTPLSLVNKNAESNTKTDEKAITSEPVKKNNIVLDKNTMWLVPVLNKLQDEKMRTPNSSKKQTNLNTDSNSKKRVKIMLQRNTSQHTSEYIQQIRQSPAIPFDASRKPLAGVLKASPIPSPINPFYRKKR